MGISLIGGLLNLALPTLAAILLLISLVLRALHQRTERRRSEAPLPRFSNVHRLTTTISESSDLKPAIEQTLERILAALGASEGSALLQTTLPDEMVSASARGLSSGTMARLLESPWRAYLASWVERWGSLMVFPDLLGSDLLAAWQRDPLFREFRDIFVAEGLRTLVVVGLQMNEKTYGTLVVGSRKPRGFQPADLRLLLVIARQVGVALDIRFLRKAAERRIEELTMLRRIGEALRGTFSIEAQLQVLRRELRELLGAKHFSLALQETPGGRLETLFVLDDGVSEGLKAQADGDELSEYVLRTRAPLMVAQDFLSATRRLGIAFNDPRTRTWCGIPIHFSDGSMGVLAVADFEHEHALDEKQFQLLQAIAQEVATAIENARLLQKERRRSQHQSLLNELGRKTTAALNPRELLVNICQQVRNAFGYEFARVETLDQERGELVVEAESGYGAEILGRRFKIGEGVSAAAAELGEPVLANAVEQDARYLALHADVRSTLSMPLKDGEQILGVLSVESRRAQNFSEQDVLTLRSLADQLAIALHNARAYQAAQEQAVTDTLTGLKTRRYFMEALETEWRRATRSGRHFSVIMMDLDDFKQVNQRRGHLEGDKVLVAIARLLKANLRQFNVLARYGADEFAILMPESGSEQARVLAERLRSSIPPNPYLASHGITASFGIATFPVHGATLEEILRAADAAMYLAKHEKGNRVRMVRVAAQSTNAEWERQLLETYFGASGKRMFRTGPEAFEQYFQRLEGATHQAGRESPSLMDTVTALAFTIDAKDRYTQGHSQAVSRLAGQIATEIGLAETDAEEIRLAGILHDIGKIGVPESLLNKPSRLTEEEYQIMKGHAALGDKILEPLKVKTIERIRPMVRHHHETFDGRGYPDGLKGEDIPLGARILSVADAFDTMVSDRAYKKGSSLEEAVAELERCSGSQFDAALVDALVRSLRMAGDPRQRAAFLQTAH